MKKNASLKIETITSKANKESTSIVKIPHGTDENMKEEAIKQPRKEKDKTKIKDEPVDGEKII